MAHLAFLKPGPVDLSDYREMAERIAPPPEITILQTETPLGLHREDALRELGAVARLQRAADLLPLDRVDCIMWACTSCSFVFGRQGAEAQARELAQYAGKPASSTSLAFAEALQYLRLSRVALAAAYPPDVTELLIQFLNSYGIEVIRHVAIGLMNGPQVARSTREEVFQWIDQANDARAEAVLVPDTALQTAAYVDELYPHFGKPVLTANQVTLWLGLRLAGQPAHGRSLGYLFEREN